MHPPISAPCAVPALLRLRTAKAQHSVRRLAQSTVIVDRHSQKREGATVSRTQCWTEQLAATAARPSLPYSKGGEPRDIQNQVSPHYDINKYCVIN